MGLIMKKSTKSSKKSYDTAMQRKAENNITIFSCSIILYSAILFLVHSMALSSSTAVGARTVRMVLMYSGIAAAMLIAAYAAYKSNKSLIKYALMGVFVSVSTAGILYCSPWGIRVTVVGLVLAFIFTCVYAGLTDKKLYYTSKKIRVIFRSVIGAVYGILLVVLIVVFVQNRIALSEMISRRSTVDAPVGVANAVQANEEDVTYSLD